MSDDIWILGITMTKFGKHPDKDVVDLAADAAMAALRDGGVSMRDIGVLAAGMISDHIGPRDAVMVMAAAMKVTISAMVGSGQKRNRSLLSARSMTLSAPPAWPDANTAMMAKPTTKMIIWMKSVTATDHMPPNSV